MQIENLLTQNSIIYGLFVVVAWHYQKANDMKVTSTLHEILLFTGTSLANRQLTSREEHGNKKSFSVIEELEKACWNGIVYEIFPEILGTTYPKCECFLWQVMPGKNFLYINMGAHPVITANETSIDPYFFMMNAYEN